MAKDTWEVFQDDDEIKVIISGSLEVGSGWRTYRDVCSEINSLEDANLIAASPEMLELLELSLPYLNDAAKTDGHAFAIYNKVARTIKRFQ